jgi:hypothetical protein
MRSFWLAVWGVGFLLAGSLHAGVGAGEIDDFEDGTTEGWQQPASSLVVNQPDGGPGGVGDNYLEVTSTGTTGPGSRLVVVNEAQWTGDYTLLGPAVEISMMLKNFGPVPGVGPTSDLHIRLGVERSLGDLVGAGGQWVSTNAVVVPNDGQWHAASFVLDVSEMTQVNGPDSLPAVLAEVTQMRILSAEAAPSWTGDQIAGQLGVDAISITQVPVELQQFEIE